MNSEMLVPKVTECICVDRELHIKLLYNGSPLPLRQGFHYDQNCCLTSESMLENVPVYLPL